MEETHSNAYGSDEDDELCVVCCQDMQICSIMDCQHTICHECSTRLRVLCEKLECPICRQKTTIALFSRQRGPFKSLYLRSLYTDERYKLAFEDAGTRQAFDALLAHQCPRCSATFSTFQQLQEHVTRDHDLFYCDICVTHLKLFNRERKLYTRDLLDRHLRLGDLGDDSYSGHPLCVLCQQRYVDHEELYLHMRRDHYHCHLCDADDHQTFCRSVTELQEHYRRKHYLCEEGECRDKRLIVFRTNIDLQAHRAAAHSEGTVGGGRQRQGPPVLTLQFSTAPAARRRRVDRRGSAELLFEASSPVTSGADGRLEFPSLPASASASAFPGSAFPAFPTSSSSATSPTSAAALSFNLNRRPTHTNVTINVNRRQQPAAAPPPPATVVGSPTGTQARISQVSSSGNITMQSPTMEQPPLIRGGRLVTDLESLYRPRQEPPPPPPAEAKTEVEAEAEATPPPPPSPPPSPSTSSPASPPTSLTQTQTQNSSPVSGSPPPPATRNYSGTNSVRFSVGGGGWTAPAEPVTSQPPPAEPVTSQLRQLSLGAAAAAAERRPRSLYIPPENLQTRSCRLVKLARDLCRSEETLRTFRQLSAEFRCGQQSGEFYYSRCLSLLGAERLARLLPELLVLLPDIGKQAELLAAHEALNKDGSHRHKFLRCPTCGQILTLADWGRHSALHFRNGEFPLECQ